MSIIAPTDYGYAQDLTILFETSQVFSIDQNDVEEILKLEFDASGCRNFFLDGNPLSLYSIEAYSDFGNPVIPPTKCTSFVPCPTLIATGYASALNDLLIDVNTLIYPECSLKAKLSLASGEKLEEKTITLFEKLQVIRLDKNNILTVGSEQDVIFDKKVTFFSSQEVDEYTVTIDSTKGGCGTFQLVTEINLFDLGAFRDECYLTPCTRQSLTTSYDIFNLLIEHLRFDVTNGCTQYFTAEASTDARDKVQEVGVVVELLSTARTQAVDTKDSNMMAKIFAPLLIIAAFLLVMFEVRRRKINNQQEEVAPAL